MKNLKKNLFGIGVAFSMVVTIAFSFAPESATASEIEPGDGYKNARNAYCNADMTIQGCKNENFRKCGNTVFCE
jgi:hypothetical protein